MCSSKCGRGCGCCPSILAKLGAGAGGFWARNLENINDALNDSNTALKAAILDTKQICLDVVVKLPLQKKINLIEVRVAFFQILAIFFFDCFEMCTI